MHCGTPVTSIATFLPHFLIPPTQQFKWSMSRGSFSENPPRFTGLSEGDCRFIVKRCQKRKPPGNGREADCSFFFGYVSVELMTAGTAEITAIPRDHGQRTTFRTLNLFHDSRLTVRLRVHTWDTDMFRSHAHRSVCRHRLRQCLRRMRRTTCREPFRRYCR